MKKGAMIRTQLIAMKQLKRFSLYVPSVLACDILCIITQSWLLHYRIIASSYLFRLDLDHSIGERAIRAREKDSKSNKRRIMSSRYQILQPYCKQAILSHPWQCYNRLLALPYLLPLGVLNWIGWEANEPFEIEQRMKNEMKWEGNIGMKCGTCKCGTSNVGQWVTEI